MRTIPRRPPVPRARPIPQTRGCFACGSDNPRGLRLRLREDERGVWARFSPPRHLRGFSRVVHGGIHAALLDEAIGVACGRATGSNSVTVSLRIDYLRPMAVGRPVTVRGWLSRRAPGRVWGRGEIRDAGGRLLARGRAKIVPLDARLAARFVGRRR